MPSARKRGAQKGNKNAIKHGIFARFISSDDDQAMEAMSPDDRKDELAMARIGLKSAWEERIAASETKEKLAWDFSTHYWLELINTLKSATAEKEEAEVEIWETFKDALRRANDRQGWKKR